MKKGNKSGDVTLHQKTEETLQNSEENLRNAYHYTRSLIEASLDPLVTINAEGKITDVNLATEKATGFPRNTLIGTDFSDYFTEPEKARICFQKTFENGSVIDYPLSIRHTSNKIIDVIYNANVYRNDQGKVLGVFAAARDITERNRVKEKRARELIIANKELETFSYSVSHDLRSPLRHINGYVDLLLSRFYESLPDKAQHYLDNIADSSRKMGTLIDDLLQFSRIGLQEKRLLNFDMNIVFLEVLASIKMAWVLICNMLKNYLAFFNAYTPPMNLKEQALALPMSNILF